MIAMAHEGSNVPPVELHRHECAMPAHRVQRVERVGDGGYLPAPLDEHTPGRLALLGPKEIVHRGCLQNSGVEYCMAAHHAFLG